jgi:hypothetical protein
VGDAMQGQDEGGTEPAGAASLILAAAPVIARTKMPALEFERVDGVAITMIDVVRRAIAAAGMTPQP